MPGRPPPHETLALLRSLRATRAFAPEPPPAALVDELIDVARWTGSARNRQPWHVAVVAGAEQRARLAALGAYADHLAAAPLVLLLALDAEHGGADGELDLGRFAQTLMLAAHAHGLGTCPVTFFPEANAAAATRLAGLAPPWHVRHAIALGRPLAPRRPAAGARSAIPRGRKPLDATRTWVAPSERDQPAP